MLNESADCVDTNHFSLKNKIAFLFIWNYLSLLKDMIARNTGETQYRNQTIVYIGDSAKAVLLAAVRFWSTFFCGKFVMWCFLGKSHQGNRFWWFKIVIVLLSYSGHCNILYDLYFFASWLNTNRSNGRITIAHFF